MELLLILRCLSGLKIFRKLRFEKIEIHNDWDFLKWFDSADSWFKRLRWNHDWTAIIRDLRTKTGWSQTERFGPRTESDQDRKNLSTGGYTFYYKKYLKENLFMWSHMQKTFILLHIRAMNIRSKFVEMSDHVSKLIFYYIENYILLHYESLTDFVPKKCGKI